MVKTRLILSKEIREVLGKDAVALTDIELVVNAFISQLAYALVQGDRIELRDFGVIKVYKTKPRLGRDPRMGTPLQIPSRRKVKFVASKKLFQEMNK